MSEAFGPRITRFEMQQSRRKISSNSLWSCGYQADRILSATKCTFNNKTTFNIGTR
jgi:hypothetical protein